MIDWPTHLPRPQQNYTVSAEGRLATNEFEINTRQRRRYSYNEDEIRVVWQMNQFQLDVFRAFVEFVLDQGANAFNTPIVGMDGLEVAEVTLVNGSFSVSPIGPNHFTVNARLARQNPTTMGADLIGILSMEELIFPDEFVFTVTALFDYLEYTYGDFLGLESTSSFMEVYS